MATVTSTGLANQSCQRCHGRKKKCDRNLPRCRSCAQARIVCSFEEVGAETGTFKVSYVRALEARIRRLENEVKRYQAQEAGTLPGQEYVAAPVMVVDSPEQNCPSLDQTDIPGSDDRGPESSPRYQDDGWRTTSPSSRIQLEHTPDQGRHDEVPQSLESGLKFLSLEATADRYLGSSSGVTFARLTQSVLKRLKPDLQPFTMSKAGSNDVSSAQLRSSSSFEDSGDSGTGNPVTEPSISLSPVEDMPLPQKTHAYRLVEYYWSHNHTLYPFVRKASFMESLDKMYTNRNDPVLLSSHSWLYTMWMIFAIGSTSFSSVMISDETESIQYWKAATFHFEATLAEGDMAALNAMMLQVSYSWFNQVGPNTWYLVGMAIRLALGIGLHTYPTEIEISIPRDVQEYRARMFFSLYMMDRLVSITLGRPFGIRDEDIEIEPFISADDNSILPNEILPHSGFTLPSTAVPLHILGLRKIAGEISNKVYPNKRSTPADDPAGRDTIVKNLHEKLIQWRRNMPFPLPESQNPYVPHLCTAWYDLNYHNHVIMLYRPSPLCPVITIEKVAILADASAMSLRYAAAMHQQHRFAFNWLNLFSVFTTSLALIYTITAQPEQINEYLRRSHALEDLQRAATLLGTFSLKFQSAKKYRDMVLGVITRLEAQLHGLGTQLNSSSAREVLQQSADHTSGSSSALNTNTNTNSNSNIDLASDSEYMQPESNDPNFNFTHNIFPQQHILGLSGTAREINFFSTRENLPLVTQVFQSSGLFDDLTAQDLAFDFDDGGASNGVVGIGMHTGMMELDGELLGYVNTGSRNEGGGDGT